MKTVSQLLREAEGLKSRLSLCPSLVGNNEAWAVQQQLQCIHGQLLVGWLEVALDNGVERDLWNIGFRNTITQLQQHTRDKQGGPSENRDLLSWFLNSASGFYLQLFNQICSAYNLDLPFRRKDSIYGAFDLGSHHQEKVKASSRKNALYLCQYCLVHLGDLARYRHQAKQAETFYRHAVVVSPSSGHPYNQLALLEAGRGNRLAAVALYVRAMCVPCPFPGAPANLTQTLTKILANSQDISGNSRVTGDEYTSIFLQFHARLYLHHDIENARASLPILRSALSTLVAMNAFTRTSLQHMVIVNLFSMYCFSGRLKCKGGEDIKKDEEIMDKPSESKENVECVHLVEELSVGVLAALLLPVHTIKDPEQLITYPAIPAVRLLFEWVRCEPELFRSEAMRSKQQIWPGLCKIVNDLQPQLADFNTSKYSELPLPEDWELQGFEPLEKMLSRYKYREGLSKASPDEYNLIRASRMQDLAKWFVEQNVDGNAVIKVNTSGEAGMGGGQQPGMFEPMQHLSPPPEEVRALEQLSLHPTLPKNEEKGSSGRKGKVGILKPQGSLERSRETREQEQKHDQPQVEHHNIPTVSIEINDREQSSQVNSGRSSTGSGQQQGQSQSRTPRTRTNVALQAIMKRNSAMQEAKQVTFKTPSPAISPNPSEASSDSHRSQLSTPPLLLGSSNSREANATSPMPQQQQQIPSIGFPGSQGNPYNHQHVGEGQYLRQQFTGQQTWPAGNNQSMPRPPSQQQIQSQNNHPNNSVLNPGPIFNAPRNLGGPGSNMGPVPTLMQQLRPNLPIGAADQLLSGLLQRPPPPPRMEGFAQMPPPPMMDSANRMREPGPQVLDMLGMTRPPPIISGMEGFGVSGGARSLDEQLQQQKKLFSQQQQQQQFKNLPRLPQGAQLPFLSMSGLQDIENTNTLISNLQMKAPSGPQSFNLESRQQGQIGNMNSNRSMHQLDSDNSQGSVGPNLSGPPPPLAAMWGSGSPNQFDNAKGFQMAHPNLANLLQQQQQQQQQQHHHLQQQQHSSGNLGALPGEAGSGDGGMVSSRGPPPMRVNNVPSSVSSHSGAGHQQAGTLHTTNPRSPPGLSTGGLPTLPPGGLPSMGPPLGLLSMTSHPPPPISNMNMSQNQRIHQSFRPEGLDSESTYSLFSPMSGSSSIQGGSGLGSGGLSGMGAGPRSNVPHPLYPTASQSAPQQIGQSLWSGPGPSPLERLLEQKKYSSVPK